MHPVRLVGKGSRRTEYRIRMVARRDKSGAPVKILLAVWAKDVFIQPLPDPPVKISLPACAKDSLFTPSPEPPWNMALFCADVIKPFITHSTMIKIFFIMLVLNDLIKVQYVLNGFQKLTDLNLNRML